MCERVGVQAERLSPLSFEHVAKAQESGAGGGGMHERGRWNDTNNSETYARSLIENTCPAHVFMRAYTQRVTHSLPPIRTHRDCFPCSVTHAFAGRRLTTTPSRQYGAHPRRSKSRDTRSACVPLTPLHHPLPPLAFS